jgi:hypothetical protein
LKQPTCSHQWTYYCTHDTTMIENWDCRHLSWVKTRFKG